MVGSRVWWIHLGGFAQSGPFSEAFRGRPTPPGREVGGFLEDLKYGVGMAAAAVGTALIYVGATGGAAAAGATGGLSAVAGAAYVGIGIADVTIGGMLISSAMDESTRKRDADKEAADKEAADKAAADKAAADKAAADKAAADKAAADKAAADKAEGGKTPPPDPKNKGETGLYDDPYGDGGGNPAWGRLNQIPVDESGGGGIGPKWLGALPADDGSGGGIGPKWLNSLPAGDGAGGGTPTSAYSTSVLTAVGPGLQSLCVRTSDLTMLILGMPKMANNGSVLDGVLGALVG
jgi:hypothetical protein